MDNDGTKEMKELVIDRALHRCAGDPANAPTLDEGYGQGETMLRNDQGFMCCLGFDALALGLRQEEITTFTGPEDVVNRSRSIDEKRRQEIIDILVKEGRIKKYLSIDRKDIFIVTDWTSKAMRLNDERDMSKKEEDLIEHFKKVGIKLSFSGVRPPLNDTRGEDR